MQIVHSHLPDRPLANENVVSLVADRATLAKRRWRGTAADGREFGFDLDHALSHGDAILRDECGCYAVFQAPEAVIEIAMPATAPEIASLAWQIGNLHFPIEIAAQAIRTSDDPAVRQMLDREHIAYSIRQSVFCPLSVTANGHHRH